MDDLAEIAKMIRRLEETGMSRRAIAEGANVGASAINPSLRLVNSLKRFCRECLDADPPRRDERFAPGCQPRAGR
ncbi:hypothetical protein [Sinorhizobium americanum]|uniref:Uncharacterized protein n=1 Tax=Sinorhizobium americanum TaxID=194963 RepID=A0A1L3LLZ4_9HYPH|nr:hypothetical protein [Sinorhizobium americanum]APG91053.1 hypothetical protein SAMCFNEI73_Ch1761 [Sinorhizobium americanum]OAP43646.1 hypothetical protein ATC00_01985 [Sinorhizobium americanum]